MKLRLILILLLALICAGCAQDAPEETTGAPPMMGIANPWKNHATLAEAEAACGFALGIPETVGVFQAQQFRVMNGYLLEVDYIHEGNTVTVRKAAGNEDISGDYTQYDEIVLADYANGSATFRGDAGAVLFTEDWSFSLYCEGSWEGCKDAFVEAVLD